MAKQKRKAANRKPITSNPLFPAVVALWFGALFGLGSLAIRPSLIENLVLSSRLDMIVPAAAPPLGITARIMMALILAALGAIIGVILARRLNRPKVEQKERSRSARGQSSARVPNRSRDAHPDAPACTPISVHDLGTGVVQATAESQVAGRRRALTVDHAEHHFVPHDFAPLPGGAPQILDLGVPSPAMPVPEAPQEYAPLAPTQLPPAQMEPMQLQPAPMPVAAPQPIPDATPSMPAVEALRQMLQPELPQPVPAQPAVAISPDSVAAHADGRQVFGMEPAPARKEKPRQIFGVAVEGDHAPQDFIREAGYRTTVFESETPEPLFYREPADIGVMSQPAPLTEAIAPAGVAAAHSPPIPQEFAPHPEPQIAPVQALAYAPQPQGEVAAPVQSASPPLSAEPPLPSPATLGMVDLASRLAESMRRRRAAKAAAAGVEPAVAAQQPIAVPPVESAQDLTSSFEPAPSQFAAPISDAFEAAPAPVAQTFAPIPIPVPAARELPSAFRPLALDAFLEDDSPLDLGLLPPRHIAMPTAPDVTSPAPVPASLEALPGEEVLEESVAEENYGSLLGINQPRAGFVRIEEPEPDVSAPEPVVIFPGQAAFGADPPAAAAVAPVPADNGAFRRFDGPGAAGHGQPLAADMPTSAVDSGAADQALRTALANLQRMSGAA